MTIRKIIVFAAVALSCIIATEACHCIRRDLLPRNPGCANEFMAILTIEGVKTVGQSSEYKVKILQDNTPSLATPASISRATHLYTASSSAACGIHLQINSTYLMKSHLSGKDSTNVELHANLLHNLC
ncbi:hypothetical protein TYRP_019109 [Tyrophagus putrescentiae]|nr:hypothetical protein TYRP_019109 [Tyrophagus putrescentiae]